MTYREWFGRFFLGALYVILLFSNDCAENYTFQFKQWFLRKKAKVKT